MKYKNTVRAKFIERVNRFTAHVELDGKPKYDLFTVRKDPSGWINIDSQAPNAVVPEWHSRGQRFDSASWKIHVKQFRLILRAI